MKNTLLITAFCSLFISGCMSTKMGENIDFERNSRVISEISKAEKIQLTYRFRNSLIDEEKQSFYDFLGTETASNELSPALNNAIGASGAFAKATFLYSTEWEEALLSGNISELIGTTLVAGALFSAITPSKERHKHQFQYYLIAGDEQNIDELTASRREQTINSIYTFADQNNYNIDCDWGCKDGTADLNGHSAFLLKLKTNNNSHATYHKPNYLYVTIDLKTLNKIDNKDSPLLGTEYNHQSNGPYSWNVSIPAPFNNADPKYIDLGDNKRTITSGQFSGSTLHRKFYELLTKENQGLSYFTNDFHNHLAFYDGKTYLLHEELTDNSIVKGVIK